MASKDKAYYAVQGEAAYTNYRDNGSILTLFARSDQSWQAKAFWTGYDAAAEKGSHAAQGKPLTSFGEAGKVVKAGGERYFISAKRNEPPIKLTDEDVQNVSQEVAAEETGEALQYAIPAVAQMHINSLHRAVEDCKDEKRRARLVNKYTALTRKWAKRAEAAQARAR